MQIELTRVDEQLEQLEEEFRRVEDQVISRAAVVCTTLTRAYLRQSILSRRFDTVLLDEASMAPIPALWAAAALSDRNVVVVGDFRQLPPICLSEDPLAKKWLAHDIFEVSGVRQQYESGFPPAWFVALNLQYRMCPEISAIVNELVYGHQLIDADGAGGAE